MEKKNLLLLAIFTATILNAMGQSEFLSLPASSYIDNIADSDAVKQGLLAEPMGETVTNRFWTTRKVSATYSFTHENSKPDDYDERDYHNFISELYLESANGLSLNIGGLFAHVDSRSAYFDHNFGTRRLKAEWNTYGISAQPAYDLFTLWNPENRPELMKYSKLVAGLGFAYSHRDVEEHVNFSPITTKLETDTFSLDPNLVFVQPICEKFTTFLIPAYHMEWSRFKLKNRSHTEYEDYGIFTLTARGDYKITERFTASAFATWKRDITIHPPGLLLDWAEFGGQLRFAISERLAVRAGYSYDAFLEYVEAHHCFARLEANF